MKRIYLFFAFIFIGVNFLHAEKYIMLIGSSENDSSVVKILTEAGYQVIRGMGTYTGTLDQSKIDSLNNAALVIFSRNGASGPHGEGLQDQWADVEAPILSLSAWILRSNRWQWINSTSTACLQSDVIYPTTEGAEHPIFSNITLTDGGVDFTEPGITRNESFTLTEELTFNTGLKVLAVDGTSDTKQIAIAEWEAGVPFYEGSPIPSSTRMFIAISEGDNCKQETIRLNQMSAFNGTENGKKLLLNCVKYLIREPIVNHINGIARHNTLRINPNPANNYIDLKIKSTVSYKVISITGSVVLKGQTSKTIDISSLSNGLYMIITDNGESAKFIKK